MDDTDKLRFDELLEAIYNGELLTAVLSSPWEKSEESILKINIRPVLIKNQELYQATDHYQKKVIHRNLTKNECALLIGEYLPLQFQQGVFSTSITDYHILANKKHRITVMKKEKTENKLSTTQDFAHNRRKNYLLQEGTPIRFLIELGIMSESGKVIAKKYDKFKQINRFVEMVNDIITHLPSDRPIEVIDFGCGKASLTFALYYYLHEIKKREVNIVGLDLKREVIAHCQQLADQLGYDSLKFAVGDINHHEANGKIDLVISLHACDTATDAALEKAVKWDADVILCVPCCQHELFGQIQNKSLSTLLRHGILRERFAALVTDAARADLLTMVGYEVQILEFIDMEHTPKNLLLRAIKEPSQDRKKAAEERYKLFRQELHIKPFLAQMIKSS